jgi:hypothetical protein
LDSVPAKMKIGERVRPLLGKQKTWLVDKKRALFSFYNAFKLNLLIFASNL